MQERGIIIVALLMIMEAFLSTSFSDGSIVGYEVKDNSVSVHCDKPLKLLEGERTVSCVSGYLDHNHF